VSKVLDDAVQAGREALGRHDWHRAYELLGKADREGGLGPEDLEALAEAAWWAGKPGDCIDARERAFAAYNGQGDRRRAAMMAMLLRQDYAHNLDSAVSAAWHKRAEQLLEGEPESVEQGYLALSHYGTAHWGDGDLDRALELAGRALDIGTRFGDKDLQAYALTLQGFGLIAKGETAEGLALFDEAMVAAVGGELAPYTTGIVYCRMIGACQDLAEYRRAGEWTEAAKRWCERQSIAGFPGVCRVHRAEIIRLRGAWAEAEDEARRASEELKEHSLLDQAGEAFAEIGTIRLRMGDLQAAEDAFAQAYELGATAQPGLALLRLAQGKPDAAASLINRTLSEGYRDRLGRARLLPAQVESALAVGDVDTARAAVKEMESISEEYQAPALHAATHQARGVLLLAQGDAPAAQEDLALARKHWQATDAPYEAARARVLLARAHREHGDRDAAAMELSTARSAFDRLGASLDAAHCSEELASLDAVSSPPERATRTFVFTDIVKSTNLLEAIGEESWQDLLRWHDQALRELFEEHSGEIVKHTGDGFFVAFEGATGAVQCAMAIQRRLADHRRAHGFAPQVRIGVHAADAVRIGDDYSGRAVHQAARIAALAEGGEILASRETLGECGDRVTVSEARTVALKGISQPIEVVSIDWR
jgi:class 3 adenylate cyclase